MNQVELRLKLFRFISFVYIFYFCINIIIAAFASSPPRYQKLRLSQHNFSSCHFGTVIDGDYIWQFCEGKHGNDYAGFIRYNIGRKIVESLWPLRNHAHTNIIAYSRSREASLFVIIHHPISKKLSLLELNFNGGLKEINLPETITPHSLLGITEENGHQALANIEDGKIIVHKKTEHNLWKRYVVKESLIPNIAFAFFEKEWNFVHTVILEQYNGEKYIKILISSKSNEGELATIAHESFVEKSIALLTDKEIIKIYNKSIDKSRSGLVAGENNYEIGFAIKEYNSFNKIIRYGTRIHMNYEFIDRHLTWNPVFQEGDNECIAMTHGKSFRFESSFSIGLHLSISSEDDGRGNIVSNGEDGLCPTIVYRNDRTYILIGGKLFSYCSISDSLERIDKLSMVEKVIHVLIGDLRRVSICGSRFVALSILSIIASFTLLFTSIAFLFLRRRSFVIQLLMLSAIIHIIIFQLLMLYFNKRGLC